MPTIKVKASKRNGKLVKAHTRKISSSVSVGAELKQRKRNSLSNDAGPDHVYYSEKEHKEGKVPNTLYGYFNMKLKKGH